MKTILVTCAIIQFDDKVLAVQRSKNMKLPLKWEFAGGKIEEGETEVECIKREILEELNIKIEIKEKLTPVTHEYPDFKIKLIPFTAEYITGKLILKEHSDFILVNKRKLINLDWAEADIPILKEYLEL
ncbi:(deoxy)nucleoside triphosphate pyrophosphohydrolase [Olleya marilimosa]|uniref:8-oxo-dGTP diphosphatase n=1 Tax=Olleya marilimosa TaxID=272164 RepID=A0ABR8LYG4_9FLAO|nr:(deoxy)nucleoside triphosphate pyrophosphohydrolase [Olleya marilimosa]MBD3864014.1 (deoxy)nucleoside triphosphate pyrophosphohydrolase [Olleya marilimosa]MBD3891643.1 (deoxy)nucleoside triphosphate pyrophosphohydrolase [Olleya marilimosa]